MAGELTKAINALFAKYKDVTVAMEEVINRHDLQEKDKEGHSVTVMIKNEAGEDVKKEIITRANFSKLVHADEIQELENLVEEVFKARELESAPGVSMVSDANNDRMKKLMGPVMAIIQEVKRLEQHIDNTDMPNEQAVKEQKETTLDVGKGTGVETISFRGGLKPVEELTDEGAGAGFKALADEAEAQGDQWTFREALIRVCVSLTRLLERMETKINNTASDLKSGAATKASAAGASFMGMFKSKKDDAEGDGPDLGESAGGPKPPGGGGDEGTE
ncbi:MAG: hypothetical protein QNK11_01875 [Legionella sp.]|nr:hypothetical protein [Legionella sp.]